MNRLDKQYTELLENILDYQIEKIIREGTAYEFEIIDSPSITIDRKSFLASTYTVYRIREHQLTSKFTSIREEFASRDEYEMIDFSLTAMEYILTFLEEYKENRVFIMGEPFNSGPDGIFMRSKTIRAIVI